MNVKIDSKTFDDTAMLAMRELLENFWILREKDAETYQLIREREKMLRDYVLDKLGYRLIVHRHFVKLEKIPALAESWMGVETFQHPRDYAMFCCLLAYLENKAVDEQFLLSQVCEELEAVYPEEDPLDWRHYEHRKSLVRVLQTAIDFGVLHSVDGDTTAFHFNEFSEALYEVTVAARYFMRSYPKDLFQFHTKEAILAAESDREDTDTARRRHRVYRQLILSPAYYKEELEEADYAYLIQYRSRIQDDLEKHIGLQLEIYRSSAMLVNQEKVHGSELFPDAKAISDIALQFSAYVREKFEQDSVAPDGSGCVNVTPVEFEQWVAHCKRVNGYGWSKQYRESLVKTTAKELLALLISWKMAIIGEGGFIRLRPLLVRLTGAYPEDFSEDKGAKVIVAEDEEAEHR